MIISFIKLIIEWYQCQKLLGVAPIFRQTIDSKIDINSNLILL